MSAVEASRRPRALVATPPARCARKAASRHNDGHGAPAAIARSAPALIAVAVMGHRQRAWRCPGPEPLTAASTQQIDRHATNTAGRPRGTPPIAAPAVVAHPVLDVNILVTYSRRPAGARAAKPSPLLWPSPVPILALAPQPLSPAAPRLRSPARLVAACRTNVVCRVIDSLPGGVVLQ